MARRRAVGGGDAAAVGAALRHQRESLGWSRPELARRLEVTAPDITRLEAGHPAVTTGLLFAAAAALGLRLAPSEAPTSAAPPEDGLTRAEAARRLGVSERAITAMIAKGELSATKVKGQYRIDPAAVEARSAQGQTRGSRPPKATRARSAPPERRHLLRSQPVRSRTAMLVDDDVNWLRLMSYRLSNRGWDVVRFTSGEEALKGYEETRPGVVVTDYMMTGLSGVELATALREQGFDGPLVLLSAYEDANIRRAGQQLQMHVVSKLAEETIARILQEFAHALPPDGTAKMAAPTLAKTEPGADARRAVKGTRLLRGARRRRNSH
ncbi:MAG TPA: response regulator [Acidimicrobiales bacterium]|nr:response regulator [Acidimicrobiales bacterium]